MVIVTFYCRFRYIEPTRRLQLCWVGCEAAPLVLLWWEGQCAVVEVEICLSAKAETTFLRERPRDVTDGWLAAKVEAFWGSSLAEGISIIWLNLRWCSGPQWCSFVLLEELWRLWIAVGKQMKLIVRGDQFLRMILRHSLHLVLRSLLVFFHNLINDLQS